MRRIQHGNECETFMKHTRRSFVYAGLGLAAALRNPNSNLSRQLLHS